MKTIHLLPVATERHQTNTKMKLTTEQIARIQDAYQTAEKFQTVEDLAAVIPGFAAFEITGFLDTEWDDAKNDDETYYQGSKLFSFTVGDDEEIELRIVGTYSIPSEDAESGNWPAETVSITEWEINEII